MKVKRVDISNLNTVEDVIRFLNPFIENMADAMGGKLTFADNMRVSTKSVLFPSVANQNLPIMHGLPSTPVGYIVARKSAACSIYDGSSLTLGATFANIKCSVAGVSAMIMFY